VTARRLIAAEAYEAYEAYEADYIVRTGPQTPQERWENQALGPALVRADEP
jgi:hypothetical protein